MSLLREFINTVIIKLPKAPVGPGAPPPDANLDSATARPTAPPAAPDLEEIDVTPIQATIAIGEQQQFTATAEYANGAKRDVTKEVIWISTSPKDVSIDQKGLATAHRARGVQVRAKDPNSDVRSWAMVEVPGDQSQVLLRIRISPEEATIESGKTLQFHATGGYADRSTKDLTKFVAWSSSDPAVVSIDDAGLAVGQRVMGRARVTAMDRTNDCSEYANVTVTVDGKRPPKGPKLKSITISPAKASIAGGAKQQFTATGEYDDKSTMDLTRLVAWSSDDEAVVSIDRQSGLATAQRGKGTAKIDAVDPDTAVCGNVDVTV